MLYFVKMPWWLQKMFPALIWQMNAKEKKLYLTFDDGPHPQHTIFVLDQLKKHHAKATFFCIGNNVDKYPDVYKRIINEGHAVGNHTYNHLNGMKTTSSNYIENVVLAENNINSNLFRPPYGRITSAQIKLLKNRIYPFKIIMWTVLSGDFDVSISKEKCLKNVLKNTSRGAIIVFHDSEKAAENMMYALPKVLEKFSNEGYEFTAIEENII
jgi:peptidoglycan-N-acetylglucosamine deacetylase